MAVMVSQAASLCGLYNKRRECADRRAARGPAMGGERAAYKRQAGRGCMMQMVCTDVMRRSREARRIAFGCEDTSPRVEGLTNGDGVECSGEVELEDLPWRERVHAERFTRAHQHAARGWPTDVLRVAHAIEDAVRAKLRAACIAHWFDFWRDEFRELCRHASASPWLAVRPRNGCQYGHRDREHSATSSRHPQRPRAPLCLRRSQ